MKKLTVLAALLLAPLLMAQAQTPPLTITDTGTPLLAPQAVELHSDLQTATGASVLLTQQANLIGVVRVDAPVAGSIPIGNASIAVSLTPGTELFPVLLQQRRDVRVFCTVATESNVLSPIRPPTITRTCLADNNGDRVFDHLAVMQVNVTPTRAVSGAWQIPTLPRVSGGAVTISVAPITSPVPFTPLQQHRIAPVTLEVTARVIGTTVVAELRSREGETSASISDQRETTPVANMPRTINLHGAQIEMVSLSEGTLTYRLVSGFSTDQPLILLAPQRR